MTADGNMDLNTLVPGCGTVYVAAVVTVLIIIVALN